MKLSRWRMQARAGVEDVLKSLLSQHGLTSPSGAAISQPVPMDVQPVSTKLPPPATAGRRHPTHFNEHTKASTVLPDAPHDHQNDHQAHENAEKEEEPKKRFFFVQDVMLRRPQASFLDIIKEWEVASTGEDREQLLANMSLREVQLLNLKANDQIETFETAKIKPTHAPNSVPTLFSNPLPPTSGTHTPPHTPNDGEVAASEKIKLGTSAASVPSATDPTQDNDRLSEQANARLYTTNNLLGKRHCLSFCHYSVAHFAAELGDVFLLRFVAEQLHDGIPFLPPDSNKDLEGRQDEMQRVTFPWLVRHGYDFNGCALSHLAAAEGNIEVLQYLVEHFGAEIILNRQQRKRPTTQPKHSLWGVDAHMEGLNAVGTAMLHGQIRVLDWLYDHYPSVISLMPPTELQHVLTAAALRDDNPNTFEFLLARGMVRTSANNGVNVNTAVEQSGLGKALVAASEAGHLHILQWFMHTFGADVLMIADRQGATPLHHCARGARAEVLRALLLGESGSALTALVDVDVTDRRGRTPAVWCVMSNMGKKQHMIETLEVLRAAGSLWPSYSDYSGNSLLDVARKNHSPFSKVCRYLKKNVETNTF